VTSLPKRKLVILQVILFIWYVELDCTRAVRKLPQKLGPMYFCEHIPEQKDLVYRGVLSGTVLNVVNV
jgi:hypothetical protein